METTQSNLVGALHRLPLFTDLTESELNLVAARVTIQRFRARETVFSERDPCRELLVVRDGRVNLLKTAANGRQQLLSVDVPGIPYLRFRCSMAIPILQLRKPRPKRPYCARRLSISARFAFNIQ